MVTARNPLPADPNRPLNEIKADLFKALAHPSRVRVLEVIPPLVDTEMSRGRGGGKVSPEYVADRVLRGMERDRQEVRIGRVKLLFAVNRVLPSVAESMMRRR